MSLYESYRRAGDIMEKEIIIFHGSENVIKSPSCDFNNSNNDFGKGFYCTYNRKLTGEWACSSDTDGYVNEYRLELEGLSVLSLSDRKYNIFNWLYVLLNNRKFRLRNDVAKHAKKYVIDNFAVDYMNYDVIIGTRADGSYFSFANAFLNNNISLSQLEKMMKFNKSNEQIVLKSEKAFNAVKFVKSSVAKRNIYYQQKLSRDLGLRKEIVVNLDTKDLLKQEFIIDILRKEKADYDGLQ